MTVNLLKIAAGISSMSDLIERFDAYGNHDPDHGFIVPIMTRNVPRQKQALLDGGSIYWIIKGKISARSRILDLREGEDADGRRLCRIIIAADLQCVMPTKRRGFQGWRYLQVADAPPDVDIMPTDTGGQDIEMAAELKELGLL